MDEANFEEPVSDVTEVPLPPFRRFENLFKPATDGLFIFPEVTYRNGKAFSGVLMDDDLVNLMDTAVSISPDARYYATVWFPIDDNHRAYVVREGEEVNPMLNCVDIHIYDTANERFVGVEPAGCVSTGGLLYQNSQTLVTYLNDDHYPDLLQQIRVWHYSGLDSRELIGRVWQANRYMNYDIGDREEELKALMKDKAAQAMGESEE